MTIEFADVSNYQPAANLAAYAASGRDRIWIRATEGATLTDPYFARRWQQAPGFGLAPGAYHFARPSHSAGIAEANHFAAVIQAAGGLGATGWVELDAEDPNDAANHGGQHAQDFTYRMVALGYPAGAVYTYTAYAARVGLTTARLAPGWQQLHIANYDPIPDAAVPLPPGWTRAQVRARQYTDAAVQPGIPGPSDCSRVLIDWLEAGDMLTIDDLKQAMREVLSDVQVPGTTDWSGAIEADVAADRADYNLDAAETAAIGWRPGDPTLATRLAQIETDVAAIRQQLAAVPPGSTDLTSVTGRLDQITAFLQSLTLTVAARSS